jgi:HK97 family phage prohead protease
MTTDSQPAGALEYRAATQIGVDFEQRIVELIVMPYEEETLVEWQGRMVAEVCSRGAFDGIERRSNRVKVNRDHDITRTVGRAIALHPGREEGLVAELRIAQTPLGDETLTLAEEGILDASAGFLPMPGGQQWETRSRRRLNKCWLGHIAMTPDPAYEGARVLAVRDRDAITVEQAAAKPNLERFLASLRHDRYSRLDH